MRVTTDALIYHDWNKPTVVSERFAKIKRVLDGFVFSIDQSAMAYVSKIGIDSKNDRLKERDALISFVRARYLNWSFYGVI